LPSFAVSSREYATNLGYVKPDRGKTPTGLLALAFKRTPLFNGALECRLFEYKMVAGGMRKKKA